MKLFLRVLGLFLFATIGAAGPVLAESRFIAPDAAGWVEKRQDTMDRMLKTIDQVAPRLGAPRTPINPAHWSMIRDNLEGVRALLRDSQAMWPPQTNLGYGSITHAEPALWSVPRAFQRHYDTAKAVFPGLSDAIEREHAADARAGFCGLVAACGNCHAAFRMIDTASLVTEGSRWLGRYPGCRGAE